MQWNVELDKFQYIIIPNNKPFTRGILSIVSSIYDPVGFVSPVIFRAKLILQRLCHEKLGWDERIPDEELLDWKRWLAELPVFERFGVERCIKPRILEITRNLSFIISLMPVKLDMVQSRTSAKSVKKVRSIAPLASASQD